jgi:hypothetical protein
VLGPEFKTGGGTAEAPESLLGHPEHSVLRVVDLSG